MTNENEVIESELDEDFLDDEDFSEILPETQDYISSILSSYQGEMQIALELTKLVYGVTGNVKLSEKDVFATFTNALDVVRENSPV